MNILYVSTLCSAGAFRSIFKQSSKKPQQQVQKLHSLLVKGLKEQVEEIYVLSRPPVDNFTRKEEALEHKEIEGNVTYHYLRVVNLPGLKHFLLFLSGLIACLNWCATKRKQEKVIICDVLNVSISVAAFLASRVCGVTVVAVVTDLPDYMQDYVAQKSPGAKSSWANLFRSICNYFMVRYDAYIVLTQQMNSLANPNNKPYAVIEGMVDSEMKDVPNLLENKYNSKVIIYAGALHEKYGVKKLIEAFLQLRMDEARLWLFGSGEMEIDIVRYEAQDHRIRYFGVVPNEVVVKEQLKATLLVNPRPSDEEFTKYSFPSKIMEYMASGTPTLTTPLPGMPSEYYNYVYLFEDETVEGMADTLCGVLNLPKCALHAKGTSAKEFVLREKSNKCQAKKIVDMVNTKAGKIK